MITHPLPTQLAGSPEILRLISEIEQNKEAFHLALRRTQTTWQQGKADWEAWILFFLRSLRRQASRLETRIATESAESQNNILSPLARRLERLFQEHETLTLAQAVALTGANRSSLKGKFQELIKAQLITLHGRDRGAFYAKR